MAGCGFDFANTCTIAIFVKALRQMKLTFASDGVRRAAYLYRMPARHSVLPVPGWIAQVGTLCFAWLLRGGL